MPEGINFIIPPDQLDLSFLKSILRKPEPFTPGETLFWDDPHIQIEGSLY